MFIYVNDLCSYVNKFFLYRYSINDLLIEKVSGIGIGIGHFGIEYRRYSKQSIGVGIGIGHHGIVPSLLSTYLSVLDVLEYLVYGNVKVLVLVLDQKVLGTWQVISSTI